MPTPHAVHSGRDNPLPDSMATFTRALRAAVREGNVGVVRALLAAPARGRARARRCRLSDALSVAAEHGYADVMCLLLADGRADPTESMLRSAVVGHRPAVVQLLLQDGRVDPAAQNGAALWLAARCENSHAFRLLLADGRVDPMHALGSAACFFTAEMTRLLLADGRTDPRRWVRGSRALRPAARWWRRRPWLLAASTAWKLSPCNPRRDCS
jgi:hypothetical protein